LQGDAALKAVAKTIEQSLSRSIDFVARWGGEEFAVLLPNTDLFGALAVAEHIRKSVENAIIPSENENSAKITISIGVNSHTPKSSSSINDFINGVDQALYDAKKSGKNKVCYSKSDSAAALSQQSP
jgi:diguanylate cyclase (GGDEF)-like protein